VREAQKCEAGQAFLSIPNGKGVPVTPVSVLDPLAGIAKGARKEGDRDRRNRYRD
jgi:hypothetical protein